MRAVELVTSAVTVGGGAAGKGDGGVAAGAEAWAVAGSGSVIYLSGSELLDVAALFDKDAAAILAHVNEGGVQI